MNAGTIAVLVPLAAIFAVVAIVWIRSRAAVSGELASLRTANAARDALIGKLEERVRVLERIVTDKSTALRDEIERLRA